MRRLEPEKELKALAFVRLLGAVHLVAWRTGSRVKLEAVGRMFCD